MASWWDWRGWWTRSDQRPAHAGLAILSVRDDEPTSRDLVIDFGPLFWPFPVIAAVGFLESTDSVALSLFAGVVVGIAALACLARRARRVAVIQHNGTVEIRNLLWTYRVDVSKVRRLTIRRSWLGGIYAECVAIGIQGRPLALPIHATRCSGDAREVEDRLAALFPRAIWRRNWWLWL